jgi:hypothetical protein
MISWRELIVTDGRDNGQVGTLGNIVDNELMHIEDAEIRDGKILQWHGYFISAPGEDPDWDTPFVEVDWTGFEEALYPEPVPAEPAKVIVTVRRGLVETVKVPVGVVIEVRDYDCEGEGELEVDSDGNKYTSALWEYEVTNGCSW